MSDIIVGAALMALSAAFLAATFCFPRLTVALSPTVFPRIVSGGLLLLSTLLLLQGLRLGPGRGRQPAPAGPRAARRALLLRFLLLAAAGLLYTFFLERAGYLVATPPFLAAVMLLFGERRWPRLVLVPVLGAAVLYAVFRMLFRVPLPRGLL